MRLPDESAFIAGFGSYCFLGKGDPASEERARICKQFAYYEQHLVNMVRDYVESDASGSAGLEGWVGVREQLAVDLVLCDPAFQARGGGEDDNPDIARPSQISWGDGVVALETKMVETLSWPSRWHGVEQDLEGKMLRGGERPKPRCDYVLIAALGFLSRDHETNNEHFREVVDQDPDGVTPLTVTYGRPPVTMELVNSAYAARWPATGTLTVMGRTWNGRVWKGHDAEMVLLLIRNTAR